MSGGNAGVGGRGGDSAKTPEFPPSLDWWRIMRPFDAGGAFAAQSTRLLFAGQALNAGSNGGSVGWTTNTPGNRYGFVGAGDFMFAVPEWFPVEGRLKRLTWLGSGALNVAGRLQLHVYANTFLASGAFAGYPYPGARLASGDIFLPATGGVELSPGGLRAMDTLLDTGVEGQTLLWFVLRANTELLGAGNHGALYHMAVVPWMGQTFGNPAGIANDALTAGCGWVHATTFNDGAPATFPTASPSHLRCGNAGASATIPAIGYGFASEGDR